MILLIEKLIYTTARELGKAYAKLISKKFGLGDLVQLKLEMYIKSLKINDYGTRNEFNKLREGN